MEKVRSVFHVFLVLIVFFGIFFGPFTWYFSEQMRAEYDDYVENGIETKGVIYRKSSRWQGKSSLYYVGIRYNTTSGKMILARKVKVEPAMDSDLEVGDVVTIYYKRPINDVNDVKIKGEVDMDHIGPIYWNGVGMVLTIFSYFMLFSFLFFKKQTMKILGLKDRSAEIKAVQKGNQK